MRRFMVGFLTICLLLALSTLTAAAQDATPVAATPVTDDEPIEVLLVQTYTQSTLTPLTDGENGATHELVLSVGSDQTIYFADHPNREVGTLPTTDAVDAFTAEPDNPPNAALVAQTVDGAEEIIVFEILNGELDTATGDLTYQVLVLTEFSEVDLVLESEPVADLAEAREYAASHLFIDDICVRGLPLDPYLC